MFEYVASGLSHAALNKKYLSDEVDNNLYGECITNINNMFKAINQDHHRVSLLFNAYIEKHYGVLFNKLFYKNTLNNIYSDSGGLQMITLGHTSTDELKNSVYDIQSNLSTVGMCFDEIPVTVNANEKTSTTNMSARIYDVNVFAQKAKETGINLKNQIEYFKNNPNNMCKPMIILQGNCFDTYQQWTDIVLNEIGHSNWKYIDGIALGGAALGQGVYEDLQRNFYCTHVELPSEIKIKHYHLLGVGSLFRMLPMMALIRDKKIDAHISYDSTTHTGGISRGNYFISDVPTNFPQYKDKYFYIVLDDIHKNMKKLNLNINITESMIYDRISIPSNWKKGNYTITDEYNTLLAYLISSIYNFMCSVDKLYEDDSYYEEYAHHKGLLIPLNAYSKCSDRKDFEEWMKCFKSILYSNPVSLKQNNDLSLYF